MKVHKCIPQLVLLRSINENIWILQNATNILSSVIVALVMQPIAHPTEDSNDNHKDALSELSQLTTQTWLLLQSFSANMHSQPNRTAEEIIFVGQFDEILASLVRLSSKCQANFVSGVDTPSETQQEYGKDIGDILALIRASSEYSARILRM